MHEDCSLINFLDTALESLGTVPGTVRAGGRCLITAVTQIQACMRLVVLTSPAAKFPRYVSALDWFAKSLTFPVSCGSSAPQAPGQMSLRTLTVYPPSPNDMLCHCLFMWSLAVTQEHPCRPGLYLV